MARSSSNTCREGGRGEGGREAEMVGSEEHQISGKSTCLEHRSSRVRILPKAALFSNIGYFEISCLHTMVEPDLGE